MPLTPNEIAREQQDRAVRAQFARRGITFDKGSDLIDVYEPPRKPKKVRLKARAPANLAPQPARVALSIVAARNAIDVFCPPSPFVRISGVYVARRSDFEVEVGSDALSIDILRLAFKHLPLEEHGWTPPRTEVRLVAHRRWKVSRA